MKEEILDLIANFHLTLNAIERMVQRDPKNPHFGEESFRNLHNEMWDAEQNFDGWVEYYDDEEL